jgi:hypothetical protein
MRKDRLDSFMRTRPWSSHRPHLAFHRTNPRTVTGRHSGGLMLRLYCRRLLNDLPHDFGRAAGTLRVDLVRRAITVTPSASIAPASAFGMLSGSSSQRDKRLCAANSGPRCFGGHAHPG